MDRPRVRMVPPDVEPDDQMSLRAKRSRIKVLLLPLREAVGEGFVRHGSLPQQRCGTRYNKKDSTQMQQGYTPSTRMSLGLHVASRQASHY